MGVVGVMKERDCTRRGGGSHIYIIQKGNLALGPWPLTADRFLSGSPGGKEKKNRGGAMLFFSWVSYFFYEIGSLDMAQADPTTKRSLLSSQPPTRPVWRFFGVFVL